MKNFEPRPAPEEPAKETGLTVESGSFKRNVVAPLLAAVEAMINAPAPPKETHQKLQRPALELHYRAVSQLKNCNAPGLDEYLGKREVAAKAVKSAKVTKDEDSFFETADKKTAWNVEKAELSALRDYLKRLDKAS